MLTFEMISLQYFANITVQISPNNKKLDIFKIYTKWAVEKCPRWSFQTPRKLRNSKQKWIQHCGTPCSLTIDISMVKLEQMLGFSDQVRW